ncbi:MAG: ABC transporter permease [Trueperaceae bacterium]|nr:MAG: ABC transporter permease [Trueperaceae bacterium]
MPDATTPSRPKGTTTFQLTVRRFNRSPLAKIGGVIVLFLFVVTVFAPFFAPYDYNRTRLGMVYIPPQRVHFFDEAGQFHLRPFTYALTPDMDPDTWRRIYTEDTSRRYPIYLFVRSWEYRLFGVFTSDLHLFGTEEGGTVHLLGTDKLGRDLLSRIIFGGRVSMYVAFFGALVSAFLGAVIGAMSGYYGGAFDAVTQRIIELLLSFPTLPLFMALSVAIPVEWPPFGVFLGIIGIFSLLSWPVLAREVRGKVLSYREEEFVTAAHAIGAPNPYIIFKHVLPNVISHVIVILTITIPELILAEGALSFLGLGIQPPMVSWGVLLSDATTLETLGRNPWIMLPGIAILVTVLAFNFLGDGLRDAVDTTSHL